MKRRRMVYYDITTFAGYWWQKGKWVKNTDVNWKYNASSNKSADTLKMAKRIAEKCPAEMIITKYFTKNGKGMCQELILRARNEKAT